MKPILLCFNLPLTRMLPVSSIAAELGITVKAVPSADLNRPVGMLAGLSGYTAGKAAPFSDEMIVFAFFPDALLDRFLAAYKKTGMTPVDLKAVLTPANASWLPAQLNAELKKEHAAMHP